MIDILRQKQFFPLKDFEDVVKIFEYNLDARNGEPNLTLLSIVAGLIEHSLVTITNKDDLAANSRPVDDRKDAAKRKFLLTHSSRTPHPSSTSEFDLKDNNRPQKHKFLTSKTRNRSTVDNEADSVSSEDSSRSRGAGSPNSPEDGNTNGTGKHEYDCYDHDDYELNANDDIEIPEIEFEVVETLYKKFVDQIKTSVDFKDDEQLGTNLKIKKISDCIWEHLSNSYYKDKAHLQSIFSYLTTSKLDCFGLAFAVIAGCQILSLKDIYLALSEDHAWVMFDFSQEQSSRKDKELKDYESVVSAPSCALYNTCEVTWHGKANSDKRGQPVTYKNCWLYTNGYAVKCDIRKCVAALVSSINPSINTNTDSETLALLQQRLLWLLFKKKNFFPMSLGNLGELENISPTPNAPLSAHELFNLGIEISQNEYNDSHVYPYSYLASFFYKHGRFKEALETWADSSAVMTRYNYSRDDEEIYKEFFEVANELIPSMLKVLTAGGLEPGRMSPIAFLQDPECLALILKFYDNICCWEEGSSTPVLHIGWAKNFVATVLKFSSLIRSKIKLKTVEEWERCKDSVSECEVPSRADRRPSSGNDRPSEKSHHDLDELGSTDTAGRSKLIKNGQPSATNGGQSDHSKASSADTSGTSLKGVKRCHSSDNKMDTSHSKQIKLEELGSSSSPDACSSVSMSSPASRGPPRERRIETDGDNNVTVVLKSRKIAGVRDLLQAERLNKTAIELQLTAQSQCAVRGRSNSSSYSSDFISSALSSTSGSTRSKRLQR